MSALEHSAPLSETTPAEPIVPDNSDIDDLRKAVDEAAGHVRNSTFLLLTVGLYIGILSGTTTHRMLLMGDLIQLPILNVGVSILWAYSLAPILFLFLYYWLLIALLSLSRRIDHFNQALGRLDPDAQHHQRALVTAFPFVEWRAGQRHAHLNDRMAGVINWLLYVGLPVGLFLWVELRFLPYQHDWITPLHIACLWIDLLLIWLFWPTVTPGKPSVRSRIAGGYATLAALIAADYLRIDQFTDNNWSRLVVTDQILMKQPPAPEILAQARMKAPPGKEDEAETAVFLDRELSEPVNLKGRNLRRADFSHSRLVGANIEGADFSYAKLDRIDLQKARGSGSKLQSTELSGAQLQGASLGGTQLQGADLRWAQLQGASLMEAQLQGADLSSAQLQGADLRGAQLQGASLMDAQLQGADLGGTQLQGASLFNAQLQGADLSSAQLQGADLSSAQLWYIETGLGTDLSLANLVDTGSDPPSREQIDELRAMRDALSNVDLRERIQARLKPLFIDPLPTWEPSRLPEEGRREVLVRHFGPQDRLPTKIEALVGSSISLAEYDPKLADSLAQLACSDDKIGAGIVRRLLFVWFYDSRPYVPVLATKLLDPACKGAVGLSMRARGELADMASGKLSPFLAAMKALQAL